MPPAKAGWREDIFIFFWTHFPPSAMGGSVDRELIIQGRTLGPEDMALIGAALAGPAGSNRTRLSRELCAVWNWLKDMACRSLLLKLEARGYIRLPPRVTASVNGLRNRCLGQMEHDQRPLE